MGQMATGPGTTMRLPPSTGIVSLGTLKPRWLATSLTRGTMTSPTRLASGCGCTTAEDGPTSGPGKQVRQEIPAPPGPQDRKERLVQQDQLDLPGQLARAERRVKTARLAQLVAQDQRARPELLEQLDRVVRQELLVLRDLLALPGARDRRVPPGIQDLLDRKE